MLWAAGNLALLILLLAACSLTGAAVLSLRPSRRAAPLFFRPAGRARGLGPPGHALRLAGRFPAARLWPSSAPCCWPPRPFVSTVGSCIACAASPPCCPAAFASFAPLGACLLRFGDFNPYNDALTYLAHAQWLQHHAFLRAAAGLAEHPVVTQVASYQSWQLRMGASFLLGWVQSLCQADWPHTVYPAVITLALACASLALAGAVWHYARLGWRWALAPRPAAPA